MDNMKLEFTEGQALPYITGFWYGEIKGKRSSAKLSLEVFANKFLGTEVPQEGGK